MKSTNSFIKAINDPTLGILLVANLTTLYFALLQHWDIPTIIWTYWVQSMIIGFFNIIRILNLKHFSTTGVKMNGHSVDPTTATKVQSASFFAIHYGIFHIGYFTFLHGFFGPINWNQVGIATLIFFANHGYSYWQTFRRERYGNINIGTLFFLPYLRIIPMHLSIIFGLFGPIGLIGFWILKTIADLISHIIEHTILDRSQSAVSN